MYKGAHEKQQRKADGRIAAPANNSALQMTAGEQYEFLKKQLAEVEVLILRGDGDKKALGKRKFILQAEMTRLRPRKSMVGLNQIFMEEARRQLPNDLYRRTEESAQHIWRCRNSQTKNDPLSEQAYAQAKRMGIEL